jgi:hypothetical protein
VTPLLTAALVVIAACCALAAWSLWRLASAVQAARAREIQDRSLRLLVLFSPAVTSAADDPRALLSWQPIAAAARKLFPEEVSALDRAHGATFPFSSQQIEDAHSRWTADWLAWEQRHDKEYKLRAAELEAELHESAGSSLCRARLEALEREKLERYQQRYAEYVRVGKALQHMKIG